MTRRLAALFLLAAFVAMGSGALEYVHQQIHAGAVSGESEQDCDLTLQLHLPVILTGYAPVVLGIGLLIALLPILRPVMTPQRVVGRVGCRGPPGV